MSECKLYEQNRTCCALGGIFTALAIEKVLPVLHAGPGCHSQSGGFLGMANGFTAPVTYPDSAVPSTNFCEEDVVFGGADRLRKLTEEALKYYNADLAIIASGCTSEIVGDNIGEVAGNFEDSDVPVLHVSLPGFKGNNVWGHSQVLNAIIDQYLTPREVKANKGQVNIFGIVPYFDPYWFSTLEKLERLLLDLGLKPNIIYGPGKGIAALNRVPDAEFNLILAPWTDLDIAEKLKEKFGTPYLHYPCVPVGISETTDFIHELVKYADLDINNAEEIIKKSESRIYYYLQQQAKAWYGGSMMPKRLFVNASAAAALSFVRFAIRDMNFIPYKVFITEDVPEERQTYIIEKLKEPKYDGWQDFDVVFTTDGGACDIEIKKVKDWSLSRATLFGTTWDELTAKNNAFPFLAISAPSGNDVIIDKSYFGYDGELVFMRDLYNDSIRKFLGSGAVAKLDVAKTPSVERKVQAAHVC
ncbi:MAG: nitrogenase molybdenum-iron protein, alpha and beta chain [Clostridiales bacterium]|jgi:nitrogenase molybdenum-iron protein beta chain|nr:nitrogenase molybdenum-iron protein, alpha and beta chain [Clostridiales bacterium]